MQDSERLLNALFDSSDDERGEIDESDESARDPCTLGLSHVPGLCLVKAWLSAAGQVRLPVDSKAAILCARSLQCAATPPPPQPRANPSGAGGHDTASPSFLQKRVLECIEDEHWFAEGADKAMRFGQLPAWALDLAGSMPRSRLGQQARPRARTGNAPRPRI